MILKRNTGQKPKRILIINPFGIGDVLFTTPVIRAIRESYPDVFIGYWCNQRVSPLLGSVGRIAKVFALSRGDLKKLYAESFLKGFASALKLTWQIKKSHFDICLDFSLDHRYSLFSKIIGIHKRIGFNYKGRGRFLTQKIDIDGYNEKHAVQYYLSLLDFLNIKPKSSELELFVNSSAQENAKNLLSIKGIESTDLLIGVAPGAGGSWGKESTYKHWPALKFAQLAERLAEKFNAKILILGDESERAIADILNNAMRNKPVDLVGKTNLEILPAIIKNCSLLITNDGGPMHMAVALGVKTVSIFGPVSEKVYGPHPDSRNHIVLKWDIKCRPCYNNFRLPHCDKDKECLRSISVDEAFTAASRILS